VTGIEVAEDFFDIGSLQGGLRAGSMKACVNMPPAGEPALAADACRCFQ